MDCQAARRASSGCVDVGLFVVLGAVGRLERRVSWMPGAEGAPFVVDEDVEEVVERLVVVVGWERGGTMR